MLHQVVIVMQSFGIASGSAKMVRAVFVIFVIYVREGISEGMQPVKFKSKLLYTLKRKTLLKYCKTMKTDLVLYLV